MLSASERYSGPALVIESEIPLPALGPAPETGAPDVTITVGAVSAPPARPLTEGAIWARYDDRVVMTVDGVARFDIRTDRVIVDPAQGVEPAEMAIFLVGTVIGIALHMRGAVVLHASAVVIDGRAALFCGPSGAGKSTMAAAMARRGFPALCDDVGLIGIDAGGTPRIHSDGRRLKLWRDAIDQLEATPGEAVRRGIGKHYVDRAPSAVSSVPVGALFVLHEDRLGHGPTLINLALPDAAFAIRRNAYRPRLVEAFGQQTDYFRAAAAIVGTGSAYALRRPFDFSRIDEGVDQVVAAIRGGAPTAPTA